MGKWGTHFKLFLIPKLLWSYDSLRNLVKLNYVFCNTRNALDFVRPFTDGFIKVYQNDCPYNLSTQALKEVLETKESRRKENIHLGFIYFLTCCFSITVCNLPTVPLANSLKNPQSRKVDWKYCTKCGLLTSMAKLSETGGCTTNSRYYPKIVWKKKNIEFCLFV